jgi:intein/homing endonuclease
LAKINPQITRKNQDIYCIELEDGQSIKLTYDHKVLTQRGYVQCKDLTLDDEILSADFGG